MKYLRYTIHIAVSLLCFLNCYKAVAQHVYTEKVFKIKDGLPSNTINKLYLNQSHQLYIGSQRGLVLYDGYHFLPLDSFSRYIESIAHYQNQYYLYEVGKGLLSFPDADPGDKKIIAAPAFEDDNPNNEHFDNLISDSKGRLWCNDFNTIKFFEPDKKVYKQFTIAPQNKTLLPAFSIIESDDSTYIFTSVGNFVLTGDTIQKTFTQFQSVITATKINDDLFAFIDQNGTLSIVNSHTRQILQQAVNNDWKTAVKITVSEGELLILTNHDLFSVTLKHLTRKSIYSNPLVNLRDFCVDHITGIAWLASDNGLIQLTPASHQFLYYPLPDNPNTAVTDIQKVNDSYYLVANNTVYIFRNGAFLKQISLPQSAYSPSSLSIIENAVYVASGNRIYKIAGNDLLQEIKTTGLPAGTIIKKMIATQNGEVWLLQESDPVIRINRANWRVLNGFKNDSAFWEENKWQDLVENDGKIWLAGWMPKSYGICYYSFEQNEFIDLARQNINDKGLFVGDYYLKIGPSADGSLLMSAYGGWNKINSNGIIQKRVDINSYPIYSDVIKGICGTKNGNIYFGTTEGLYLYKESEDRVYAFTEKEGLPGNNLTFGFKLINDSLLALGIKNGFILADLQLLTDTKLQNRIAFSEIRIDGVLQNFSAPVIFKPENNLLDIKFSALTYSGQHLIQYRYRFSPDEAWINIGSNTSIALTHLPYGAYDLEIQAGDHLNNWQTNILKLKIESKTPFLKSGWFLVALITAIILFTIIIARYFINKAKKENALQRKIVSAEMKALRSQMNPHFLFNSLNAIHSTIIQNNTTQASRYLSTFSKLLRNILEYSQQDSITLKEELDALKLYLELESARLEHLFNYTVEIDEAIDENEVKLPPMIIQPFVENAIWHGIRNISYEGYINIKVQRADKNAIRILITDNGIGRTKASEHQSKAVGHKHLGMNLSKERLQLVDERNYIRVYDLNQEDKTGTIVEIFLMNLYK